MCRAFEKLTKTVEEKDFQIATLMNKLELQANEESNQGEVNEASKKGRANGRHDESTFGGFKKEDRSNSVASLSVQQLQDMITSTIRAQYGGPSRNKLMYSKPYTKKCVDWYIDIEPESIDYWEAMEREFLNRFYSTRRSVSMMELTNTKQWKDELVVDYINKWRSLSLDCKERLSEISTVEMCMQGMHWGLLYILQGNRPTSFEELATRAHDMEISIANHSGNSPALPDPRKERKKDSLAVTTAPLKVPKKDKYKEEKVPEHLREKPRQQPLLKELEGMVYPFLDSDVPGILNFLLEKRIIELPESKRPKELGRVNEPRVIEADHWKQPLIDYLEHGRLPEDIRHKTEIRRRVPRFIYYKDTLFRRSYEGLILRCLGEEEADQAMDEAHSGICGAHQSGPKLHFQIKRIGYYWPTMVKDYLDFAKRCQACQFHANFIYQPPEPLHPTVASWPFDTWGLNVVGPLPKSSRIHLYILAMTDYFSKWAEAVPLKEVKKEIVVNFIKSNLIFRCGVPRYTITDNGKPFYNTLMDQLCTKFGFKQNNSSMYNAPTNGLVEAFNKTLCNLLKKVMAKSKKDWHEKIGEALCAYRTTYRTPTQATPYSLVYGVEVVLPLEKQIPLLRIAIQEGLTSEDNARLRLEELEAHDEKRLEAQQHLECYQARLSRAFNKRVRPRSFTVGDLVLAVQRPIIITHRTGKKFTPKWDGPYMVKEVYTNGSYKIVDQDVLNDHVMHPIIIPSSREITIPISAAIDGASKE
ncbi:hypothetical protein RJ639_022427 [Escallonia herrerae]|uniref:Integrase catalytic domain-containing protein n=1 Tax=Escallonia herrerae TaxID=1293975 RepID=A0AA88V2X2_9ASTE|nr:hypothetical protein RJ639_022427 [Escallonia herrerae]